MDKKEQLKILSQEQIENLTFDNAIKNLTDIVEKMESGQTPLEESITQYEQGMAIINRCKKILTDAEKKIQNISDKTD